MSEEEGMKEGQEWRGMKCLKKEVRKRGREKERKRRRERKGDKAKETKIRRER